MQSEMVFLASCAIIECTFDVGDKRQLCKNKSILFGKGTNMQMNKGKWC